MPDLFAGQPLVVVGKYRGHGPATVEDHRASSAPSRTRAPSPVSLASQPGDAVLRHVVGAPPHRHAHRRDRRRRAVDQQAQIVDLALKFKLITAYTSFVAVEKQLKRRHAHAAGADAGAERAARGRLVQGHLRRGGRAGERRRHARAREAGRSGDSRAGAGRLARARDAAVVEAPGARGVGRADGRARRALPRAGRLARRLVDGDGHD